MLEPPSLIAEIDILDQQIKTLIANDTHDDQRYS